MAKRNQFSQLSLFDEEDDAAPSSSKKSSTFADNMALPVHRWFRYSAGFSALWVRDTIRAALAGGKQELRVLDPFAGSGTVPVEAENAAVDCIGVESHPFVARVARAKTANGVASDGFRAFSRELLKRAAKVTAEVDSYPPLIRKCYPDDTLSKLDQLRRAWMASSGAPEEQLGWLTLVAILRQCSPVGTANWQYVLPKKTKAKTTGTVRRFPAQGRPDLSRPYRAARRAARNQSWSKATRGR